MSEVRTGVFVCRCGERMAGMLNLDALAERACALPGVVYAQPLRYSCSPDGLAAIRAAIAEQKLNRVVIAGCAPRALAPRLRRACEEAGLDGQLFDLVDIREGCAWPHAGEPEAAQAKAADLIAMGVVRVALRQVHRLASAQVAPAALVIGGGLAGMTAALALANAGVEVHLVEREATLGGMLRDAHTPSIAGRCAAAFLATKALAVTRHPRIKVWLESRVTEVSGTVGHYTLTVAGGPGSATLDVGAIIVATGAQALRPRGLYRYDGECVLTQAEFERELARHDGAAKRPARGNGDSAGEVKPLRNVVMILCAGQRDDARPYCSRVCCPTALAQALAVKAISPQATVTLVCRELCLPPDAEDEVRRAHRAGVEFVRYALSSPPAVGDGAVEIRDEGGRAARLPYDRVVLATPLVPQTDAGMLAHLLGLAQDGSGFFPAPHYRLRSNGHAERGVYVCGAAHGPAVWNEVIFQATATAFRALRYLRAGTITSHDTVAVVDKKRCTGCGTCVGTCPFGAIALRQDEGLLSRSQVDPLRCQGCGDCAVACPVGAIDVVGSSQAEVWAQIEAALACTAGGEPRILALGCEWSAYAAGELAGARRMSYPAAVRMLSLTCSARFDPACVLWAFHRGADGVFLGACPPGQCHYIAGNRHARERIEALQAMLAESGFDPRRLRLEWVTPDDPGDFVDKITAFTDLVRALGPTPLRVGP